MDLTAAFAVLLRRNREARGLSQDELAAGAGLDRTYISQLERGLKSPTLQTLEKLCRCLNVPAAALVSDAEVPAEARVAVAKDYVLSGVDHVRVRREVGPTASVPAGLLLQGVEVAHELIDQMYAFDLDIAAVLGMRNLSGFIGELLAAAVERAGGDLFRANPHQDGYPDLLLMDAVGRAAWERVADRAGEKQPFSPFAGGGIEIKATCGSVSTPQVSRNRGVIRPGLGDTRIGCLTSYDWKAHHRDTNNLVGILWDFLGGRPRIVALFYCDQLVEDDWGAIVQPRAGGGRTTSVSIMSASGVAKMYAGWLCILRRGGYAEFLNRRNRAALIPTG